jgi:hypothetical protein
MCQRKLPVAGHCSPGRLDMGSDDVKTCGEVQLAVPACFRGASPIVARRVSAALHECVLGTVTGELDCPLAAMMLEESRDESPRARGTGVPVDSAPGLAGPSLPSCVDRFLESPEGPHDMVFLDAIAGCVVQVAPVSLCPLRRALAATIPSV